MSNVRVRDTILGAISEVKGSVPDLVSDDSQLGDLELDSLDLLEVSMIVEQRLRVIVPTERLEGLRSFGEVVAVFEAAVQDPSS